MRRLLALCIAPLVLLCASVLSAIPSSATTTTSVFPTVKGLYGKTPTITFPNVTAPKGLESKVLDAGNGPLVKKGDLLVANYVGQIWRGKVFDSSFSRGELAAFPIGVGAVIPGWDQTLVGKHLGSRMLLVIPPVDGYGPSGATAAGITGTDTIVFVVDLVSQYTKTAAGDVHATQLRSNADGVTVTGSLGKQPTVKVAKGAKAPTKLAAVVLAKGHGKPVKSGLIIMQYVVTNWSTSQVVQSTWQTGVPDGEVVGVKGDTSNPLDPLVGIPVGSRVLLELPKTSSGGPYVLALDIVAEPTES